MHFVFDEKLQSFIKRSFCIDIKEGASVETQLCPPFFDAAEQKNKKKNVQFSEYETFFKTYI